MERFRTYGWWTLVSLAIGAIGAICTPTPADAAVLFWAVHSQVSDIGYAYGVNLDGSALQGAGGVGGSHAVLKFVAIDEGNGTIYATDEDNGVWHGQLGSTSPSL